MSTSSKANFKTKYGKLPLQECSGNTYFIGDVHNEADKLMNLLDKFLNDFKPEDRIVFLGDLVDRGTQAALLVDVLVDLNRKYPGQIFFVRGNHDWMLQDYLTRGRTDYMQYIGITLQDFKGAWNLPDIAADTIMQALIARGYNEVTSKFIPYYETEDTIGTHATFDQSIMYMYAGYKCIDYKNDYQDYLNGEYPEFQFLMEKLGDEIIWMFTDETLDVEGIDKFHVCGHQPPPGRQTHPRLYKNRAFIDTGCGKGDRPVTALIYPGKKYLQSDR